jgi:predicted dehydrogenase
MRLYEDPRFSIQLFSKEGEKTYFEVDKIQTNDDQTCTGVIDAFIQSVITKQSGELAAEKVLESMKVIFASIESSQTGKTVQIK